MLRLQSETPKEWAAWAADNMNTILLDHAHCEKKAASTAINLIFRYPEYTQLLRPLSELAREELEHFELVLSHLEERNIPYTRLAPSPYAGKLMSIVRSGEPDRLIDVLLCCAAIEARSCERMKVLANSLTDPVLAELYRGLLASEARHHSMYVDLAESIGATEMVRERLKVVMEHEADVIKSTPRVPRMHN